MLVRPAVRGRTRRNFVEPLKSNAVLRLDPQRSATLRRQYTAEMNVRFAKIISAVVEVVDRQDAFGLKPGATPRFFVRTNANPRPRFDFPTNPAKLNAFSDWFASLVDDELLEVIEYEGQRVKDRRPWQDAYVRAAYGKGVGQASDFLRRAGVQVPDEPISAAFGLPIHATTLEALYTRNFEGLRGISSAMSVEIGRVLSDGLASGLHPYQIAKDINGRVRAIGLNRARVLARTELSRAHADATLNRYEQYGVDKVNGFAEFSTSNTGVCPICRDLEGKEYRVKDAAGVIPVHPNCRCTWLPVVEVAGEIQLVTPGSGTPKNPSRSQAEKARQDLMALDARHKEEIAAIERANREIDKGMDIAWDQRQRMRDEKERILRLYQDGEISAVEYEDRLGIAHDLMQRATSDYVALKEKRRRVPYDRFREETRALLAVESPLNFSPNLITRGVKKARSQRWKDGVDSFSRLVDNVYRSAIPRALRSPDIGTTTRASRLYGYHKTQRSYYAGAEVGVALGNTAGERVVVHELGHWLDDANPRIGRLSKAFLRYRTQGEDLQSLRDLTGIDSYREGERALPDAFMTPYMGKVYGGNSNEITSMGLEYMYANPVEFARRDPEMFGYIYDVSRGNLDEWEERLSPFMND